MSDYKLVCWHLVTTIVHITTLDSFQETAAFYQLSRKKEREKEEERAGGEDDAAGSK
jgi:hypothetical protein